MSSDSSVDLTETWLDLVSGRQAFEHILPVIMYLKKDELKVYQSPDSVDMPILDFYRGDVSLENYLGSYDTQHSYFTKFANVPLQ